MKLYTGQTKINSVRFIELEGGIFRALVNCDVLFMTRTVRDKLMRSPVKYIDAEMIEITFHFSEREWIENAIMDRLRGGEWPELVYYGDGKDYAWTKMAIEKGRPFLRHSR